MDNSSNKFNFIQALETAMVVAGLVIPLMLWGIDAKFDGVRSEISSIKTMIEESDRRQELRQAEAEKRQAQWQELMKDVIDAKTSKK